MTYKKLIILSLCLLLHWEANAQLLDTGHKVDTLSFRDRISIRTNGIDWLCLTPNIGIEYDIQKHNWGHWAITLDVRGNWETNTSFKSGTVYNISGARLGLKYYYRFRKTGTLYKNYGQEDGKNNEKALFRGQYPQIQDGFLDRLFTCRSDSPRHAEIAFYRGGYVSYNNFSIKLGHEGKQGSAMTAGLTWGFVKPLYGFANGNSLDFEAGISAGLTYAKYTTYTLDRESNCYTPQEFNNWALRLVPVISDLRLGFVYRIGKYPLNKKYRWRYDCDLEYQSKYDDMLNIRKNRLDSLSRSMGNKKIIHEEFMRVFNEEAAKIKTSHATEKADAKKAAEAAQEKKRKDKKEAKKQKKVKPESVKSESVESESVESESVKSESVESEKNDNKQQEEQI